MVDLWSRRNITLRYKRSVLGILWTLLEPLMLMIILTVVFSTIFRFAVEHYPIYLLSGLILYDFFSRSTSQIADEIIASQNLAQRIHLPRSVFAVAAVISYLFNWALALIPLAGIMLVLGHPFTWSLLSLPFAVLPTLLFALGVGLIVATLGCFFHDIRLTYGVLLSALFYLTPIIYPLEIVPERYRLLLQLNPLFHLVNLFRMPLYEGQLATPRTWLIGCASSLATLAIGWWIFTRSRKAFEYNV